MPNNELKRCYPEDILRGFNQPNLTVMAGDNKGYDRTTGTCYEYDHLMNEWRPNAK